MACWGDAQQKVRFFERIIKRMSCGRRRQGPRDKEVNAISAMTVNKKTPREINITVDSGAAVPVVGPETFDGAVMRPSAGSTRGQCFLGPGGERMPNMGEIAVLVRTEAAKALSQIRFQVAKVRKPLLAVSGMVDEGNMVIFDGVASLIVPADAPELIQIRALAQRAKSRIPLHRESGVYVMKTWYTPPETTESGFTRQVDA